MIYLVIKNIEYISKGGKAKYWGYVDGVAPEDGKPNGWVTEPEHIHLYESEVKFRYAKAEVIAKCTDVEAKYIKQSEVYL